MGKDQRRLDTCVECGRPDMEMVGKDNTCYACYRRAKRAENHEPDLHNPSLRKEHVKLVRQYTKLMEVFAALKLNDDAKDAVMRHIAPYFRTVAHLVNLGVATDQPTQTVFDHSDEGDDEVLARIKVMPDMAAIIHDPILGDMGAEARRDLELELWECDARHRAEWKAEDARFRAVLAEGSEDEQAQALFDRKSDAERVRALCAESVSIAARLGSPRALAVLKRLEEEAVERLEQEIGKAKASAKRTAKRDRAVEEAAQAVESSPPPLPEQPDSLES